MSKTPELLPCPFCGGNDIHVRRNRLAGMSWVACVGCGLQTPTETGVFDQDAIDYWNRRAALQSAADTPPPSAHTAALTDEQRGVGIGMAIAAGIVMKSWGNNTYAREILRAAGLDTLEKLKASGVDQYDIDLVIPALAATATEAAYVTNHGSKSDLHPEYVTNPGGTNHGDKSALHPGYVPSEGGE